METLPDECIHLILLYVECCHVVFARVAKRWRKIFNKIFAPFSFPETADNISMVSWYRSQGYTGKFLYHTQASREYDIYLLQEQVYQNPFVEYYVQKYIHDVEMIKWLGDTKSTKVNMCIAKYGTDTMLEWSINTFPYDQTLLTACISSGHIETFKKLVPRFPHLESRVVWYLAMYKYFDLLREMLETTMCYFSDTTLDELIYLEETELCLSLLSHKNGVYIGGSIYKRERMIVRACASYGNLKLLKHLLSGGWYISVRIACTAAYNGQWKVLFWLLEHGCPRDSPEILNHIASRGTLDHFIGAYRVYGCPIDTDIYGYAGMNPSLEIFEYLYSIQIPWSESSLVGLIENHKQEWFEWAVQRGCPLPPDISKHIGVYGNTKCLQWCLDHNIPLHFEDISILARGNHDLNILEFLEQLNIPLNKEWIFVFIRYGMEDKFFDLYQKHEFSVEERQRMIKSALHSKAYKIAHKLYYDVDVIL